MKISVILPTYNEAENIVKLVREIQKNIPSDLEQEIIVVDDDSPDHTYQIVLDAYKDQNCVKAILRTTNRGLAKSIRTGIEQASGDKVLVMDTDFTHDPNEIPRMIHISKVFDLISGSRFCPGGRMDSVRHYIASLCYNWMIRIVLGTQIQDNLGGFFIVDREKLVQFPFDKIFFGYGEYFFRLLYFTEKAGLSIVEIPAYYHTRSKGKSKSNFAHLLVRYSSAILKLKFSRE